MGTNNLIFLEVIEWFDPSGKEMLQRIPAEGSGEIKYGAQLIVRESQGGVFFYNGRAYDVFGPGRHTLVTGNVPLLNKILSIPWGLTSPLRAEVYFTNMKTFPNLRWGTRDPVAFKDAELGLVRLRAFGIYSVRILQPVLFINNLVGTRGVFSTGDIEEFLGRVIVSRLNDHLGEHLDSLLSLPGKYEEIAAGLRERLEADFSHFGLGLTQLFINSITPPDDVQRAIDDKSRLGVLDDLNDLLKMKAAMALEKVSEQQGEAGAGVGMGLGVMMPSFFAGLTGAGEGGGGAAPAQTTCPECSHSIPADSRFCPACGHQLVVFRKCGRCEKNVSPHASFCPRCGSSIDDSEEAPKNCGNCGAENLGASVFCNQCGEKL